MGIEIYNQLLNRKHLLKKLQKEKNKKINFAVLNGHFQNLVIGIVSAFLAFVFTHNYTESIIKNIRANKETRLNESVELKSTDSFDPKTDTSSFNKNSHSPQ